MFFIIIILLSLKLAAVTTAPMTDISTGPSFRRLELILTSLGGLPRSLRLPSHPKLPHSYLAPDRYPVRLHNTPVPLGLYQAEVLP